MGRNIDTIDLPTAKRRVQTFRLEIELDDSATPKVTKVTAHRVTLLKSNGVVLTRNYDRASVPLTNAELDAVNTSIINRIQDIDALADAKEILLETPPAP